MIGIARMDSLPSESYKPQYFQKDVDVNDDK